MEWLNEPPAWQDEDGVLSVVTGEKTDFWRETHYGFVRDDGHFRHVAVPGNFSATAAFRGDYQELYDQAGLILRLDAARWIKAGIEYVAGRRMLSTAVTRDVSDWSTMPLPVEAEWIGTAVHVHWAADSAPDDFRMLRLAWFPEGAARVGRMCCSPQRTGFRVNFRELHLDEAVTPEEAWGDCRWRVSTRRGAA